jgi:hypothetical protein
MGICTAIDATKTWAISFSRSRMKHAREHPICGEPSPCSALRGGTPIAADKILSKLDKTESAYVQVFSQ